MVAEGDAAGAETHRIVHVGPADRVVWGVAEPLNSAAEDGAPILQCMRLVPLHKHSLHHMLLQPVHGVWRAASWLMHRQEACQVLGR